MKLTSSQIAGLMTAAAIVVVGKHYIRTAGADQLGWLLAPTAHLVSATTGSNFVRESGVGWLDRRVMFEIAPVCSGFQFFLAAWLAVTIGWLEPMRTWVGMATRIAAAGAVAYLATLVVNTLRISIAVWMHVTHTSSSDLHRLEGIFVYFGGLCALYGLATARRGVCRLGWIAVPLGVYLVVTVALPMMNGAASRPDFGHHSLIIAAGCSAVVAAVVALGLVRTRSQTLPSRAQLLGFGPGNAPEPDVRNRSACSGPDE